jgi:hypothetical protein
MMKRYVVNNNLQESLSLWTLHLSKHIFVDCEVFDIYFSDSRYVFLQHFVSTLTEKYINLESGNSRYHTSHRKLLGSLVGSIIKSQHISDGMLKDSKVVSICEPILRRMRQDAYWKIRLMCFTLLTRSFKTRSNNSKHAEVFAGLPRTAMATCLRVIESISSNDAVDQHPRLQELIKAFDEWKIRLGITSLRSNLETTTNSDQPYLEVEEEKHIAQYDTSQIPRDEIEDKKQDEISEILKANRDTLIAPKNNDLNKKSPLSESSSHSRTSSINFKNFSNLELVNEEDEENITSSTGEDGGTSRTGHLSSEPQLKIVVENDSDTSDDSSYSVKCNDFDTSSDQEELASLIAKNYTPVDAKVPLDLTHISTEYLKRMTKIGRIKSNPSVSQPISRSSSPYPNQLGKPDKRMNILEPQYQNRLSDYTPSSPYPDQLEDKKKITDKRTNILNPQYQNRLSDYTLFGGNKAGSASDLPAMKQKMGSILNQIQNTRSSLNELRRKRPLSSSKESEIRHELKLTVSKDRSGSAELANLEIQEEKQLVKDNLKSVLNPKAVSIESRNMPSSSADSSCSQADPNSQKNTVGPGDDSILAPIPKLQRIYQDINHLETESLNNPFLKSIMESSISNENLHSTNGTNNDSVEPTELDHSNPFKSAGPLAESPSRLGKEIDKISNLAGSEEILNLNAKNTFAPQGLKNEFDSSGCHTSREDTIANNKTEIEEFKLSTSMQLREKSQDIPTKAPLMNEYLKPSEESMNESDSEIFTENPFEDIRKSREDAIANNQTEIEESKLATSMQLREKSQEIPTKAPLMNEYLKPSKESMNESDSEILTKNPFEDIRKSREDSKNPFVDAKSKIFPFKRPDFQSGNFSPMKGNMHPNKVSPIMHDGASRKSSLPVSLHSKNSNSNTDSLLTVSSSARSLLHSPMMDPNHEPRSKKIHQRPEAYSKIPAPNFKSKTFLKKFPAPVNADLDSDKRLSAAPIEKPKPSLDRVGTDDLLNQVDEDIGSLQSNDFVASSLISVADDILKVKQHQSEKRRKFLFI